MTESECFLFELPPQNLKVAEQKFRERNPIWTECKAKLIERYLFYFVQITFHGTYIDAFAGPQEPDKPDMWAVKLVMESTPRWLKNFFLFESNRSQLELIRKMCGAQSPRQKEKNEPKRRIEVYDGDFNQNIERMFTEHPIPEKEATFCLLDQRTFECDWKSVETVARHKTSGRKVELFYFFPEGWLNRSAAGLKIDKVKRLQRWWGNSGWDEVLKLTGARRAQHVCDRFRSEFQYKHVYPFPIYEKQEQGGRVMYYMVHASDHDEAPVLMNRAYGKALDIKETEVQMDFLRDALQALSLTNSIG